MTVSCILGVDPGVTGGMAFYFPCEPHHVAVYDMPEAARSVSGANVAALVKQFLPTGAVIEQSWARPLEGPSGAFKFGDSYGVVRGVIAALGVPIHFASPQKWKRHYGLGKDKDASRAKAIDYWPVCAHHFSKKKDHGRAEAALIARYGAERVWK